MSTQTLFDLAQAEPNPILLQWANAQTAAAKVAAASARSVLDAIEKQAGPMDGGMPPPGGMPPAGGAPGGGAAPPMPDPSGGAGGGPLDPAAVQQIAMAVGGGGGAGGKPGGKPPKEQIMSAQLYNITYLLVQMAQKAGITVPPAMLLGPPPDPGIAGMAQQDMSTATSAPNLAQDPNAQGGAPLGGGAPPGGGAAGPGMPQPVQPMDAGSGPIGGPGKQASVLTIDIGQEIRNEDLEHIVGGARGETSTLGASARALLLGNLK